MPLILFTVAFVVFTVLLSTGTIGSTAYCFLVAVSALLGLVLHGFGRLKELDLKNLRLVLRGIEQTKHELFVREHRLKAVLVPLAQVLAYTSAAEGRWSGSRESIELKREWYRQKINALIAAMDASEIESAEISKYMGKFADIDRAFGARESLRTDQPDYAETKSKIGSISLEIEQMMKSDLLKGAVNSIDR